MSPDVWTSSAVAALFVTVLAGLQCAIWLKGETHPGFGRWTIAMVLFTLPMIGVAWRPPAILWTFFITPAVAAALILALEACREFRGLRPQLWMAYGVGVLAVILAGYFQFAQNLLFGIRVDTR